MRALLALTILLAAAMGCAGTKLDGGREPAAVGLGHRWGSIEVEVQRAAAPVTAENFLRYVRGGFYNGGRFHRTIHPRQPTRAVRQDRGVIQAGVNPARKGGISVRPPRAYEHHGPPGTRTAPFPWPARSGYATSDSSSA